MIMNHLNLTVSDVAAAKGFLEKYFGLIDIGGGNKNRAFLRDDRWLVLSMFKGKDATYPGAIGHMINPILPAAIASRNSPGDWVNNAAKESARRTAKRLTASKLIATGIAGGKIKVTAAIYDLQTGVVSYLDQA